MQEVQEASGIGRFSFGYFSLDKQRKVSRPWVREPTYKTIVALATHYVNVFILRQAQDERLILLISGFDKALLSSVEGLTSNGLFKPSLVAIVPMPCMETMQLLIPAAIA
jgi:hypothetical protein